MTTNQTNRKYDPGVKVYESLSIQKVRVMIVFVWLVVESTLVM